MKIDKKLVDIASKLYTNEILSMYKKTGYIPDPKFMANLIILKHEGIITHGQLRFLLKLDEEKTNGKNKRKGIRKDR